MSQRENYDIIDELRCSHGITRLLTVAGISRSSYYKWRATQPQRGARQDRDREIKEHMMAIHFANREFGYPRMTTALWEAGLNVNHKKVWRIMRELSIQSVIRKKRKKSSYSPSVIYPNRLKREFHATAPQQKMVTDITYISDGSAFVYLSVIQDLFNNEIVAWQCSIQSGLPVHVTGVQLTIRSIRRQRQPLSQSNLPG
ncbi:IS3 family transposase [Paenibacillus sp. NPDC057886]|uniref:IS3 family transposase n=1 Tax=Paenibacillus sp. NPDC057886 TaxID=3346270 RepID=UPI00368C36C3